MADAATLQKSKLVDLRKMCKEAGLATTGVKAELVSRLSSAAEAVVPDDSALLEEDDSVLADESMVDKEAVLETEEEASPIKPVTESTKATELAKEVVAKTAAVKAMTAAERLALRQERFGAGSEDSKKTARATRFGISDANGTSKTSAGSIKATGSVATADLGKLKARGERFGSNVSSQIKKLGETEALQKRKERFGGGSSSSAGDGGSSSAGDAPVVSVPVSVAPGTKRSLASGLGDAEAKKKARAARFGIKE